MSSWHLIELWLLLIIHQAHHSSANKDTFGVWESNLEKNLEAFFLESPMHTESDEREPAMDGRTLSDFFSVASNSNYSDMNISPQCQRDVDEFKKCFRNHEPWALRMGDSSSKMEAGVFTGNARWTGDYDQCINNSHLYQHHGVPATIHGQYCFAHLQVKIASTSGIILDQDGISDNGVLNIDISTCAPSSCSNVDVRNLIFYMVNNSHWRTRIGVSTKGCIDHETGLTTGAISASAVVGFIVLMMILGTTYDIVRRYSLSRNKSSFGTKVSVIDSVSMATVHGQDKGRSKRWTKLIQGVFLSFSVRTNGETLLNNNVSGSTVTLGCVHGIRFLSLTWVIIGHIYANGGYTLMNRRHANTWTHRWSFQVLDNETVSVDSFFTLSGLLVAYLTLTEMKAKNGRINWLMFYLHRYYRLTLPYALVMLFYAPLFNHWYYGPMWFGTNSARDDEKCKAQWWHNLLYVNNLTKGDLSRHCMLVTWYLANDMQFFILTPLMILPVYFYPRIGYVVWLLFMTAMTVTPGVISYQNKFAPSMTGPRHKDQGHWDDYYVRPWCRMGPYLVGMAAGYLIYKTEGNIRIPKIVNVLCWFTAAITACSIIYGLLGIVRRNYTDSVEIDALYNAVARSAWGAAISWVIFACVTGNGGFVNRILSWGGILPLSRLGYMAYLIHIHLVDLYFGGLRKNFYATDLHMVLTFAGMLVAVYSVSFILALAFESPIVGLEKVLLKREKRS